MKAIALQDTTLTKDNLYSGNIKETDRVFEVSAGSGFNLRAIAAQLQGSKRLVTFDKGLGPANFNTWFLYPPHWKIEGAPRTDFDESHMATAAHESSVKPVDGWNDGAVLISQFFTVHDVTNGDDRRIPEKGSEVEANVLKMAQELDKVRSEWGSPIGVTSWNRPYAINYEVGGVSNSQHITGGAADIYTLDGRDYEFEDFLDRHWGGGLGYGVASGKRFTHLDLREGGWRNGPGTIRWMY
jgi:Peptidase M15